MEDEHDVEGAELIANHTEIQANDDGVEDDPEL